MENRSIAGVVLILPDAVDTGEAAVVEEVEGFLVSSFRRCSCRKKSWFHVGILVPTQRHTHDKTKTNVFYEAKNLVKIL